MADRPQQAVQARLLRKRWLSFAIVVFVILSLLGLGLLARAILFPAFVAFTLSYLIKPLVYVLRRRGVSAGLAVFLVAASLVFAMGFVIRMAMGALPQGSDLYEAKVRAEYRLNQKMMSLMGLQPDSPDVHWIYKNFPDEIDYLMLELNSLLRFNSDDQRAWSEQVGFGEGPRIENYKKMAGWLRARTLWQPVKATPVASASREDEVKAHLALVVSSVTLWILMPILFFFLLADHGSIERYFLGFIPNHYFELALTLLERVDRALGHYLRGTALECFFVGLVISLGLFIFGADLRSAILIGGVAGITNAIPFLGTFVGLVVGMGYALVAENLSPALWFLSPDDMMIGVLLSVGIAHLLDNAIFQPVLVGKAVSLHPVVVVLAAAGGGLAFGFAGVLLAIPSVVVTKTFLQTLVEGLKDYRLI